MDHRSPKTFSGIVYQWHNTMDDNKWVNSEKEACSATFSYWAATGKSTGWNWPPGWKRSHEAKRHLITSFLGLFYPTLRTKLKSETVILGGVPCSQSVRRELGWAVLSYLELRWFALSCIRANRFFPHIECNFLGLFLKVGLWQLSFMWVA